MAHRRGHRGGPGGIRPRAPILTREEFIAALAQGGVDPATFRDFVPPCVAWRGYCRTVPVETAEDYPPVLLDRAGQTAELEAGRRVLLTEIILRASTPEATSISRDGRCAFRGCRRGGLFRGRAAREFSLAGLEVFGASKIEWAAADRPARKYCRRRRHPPASQRTRRSSSTNRSASSTSATSN